MPSMQEVFIVLIRGVTLESDTFLYLVRLLREELQLLHEPGSYVGEVVKAMGKNKVLVKVQPEGKYSACSYLL